MTALPSFRLDGRRAAVTGAGRGLGLAIARGLAEAGAEVTLIARSGDEVAAAAEAIRDDGGRAEAAALDVTDLGAVREFFDARPAFHALVNNAGTAKHARFLEVEENDFDAVFALNVRAAFFVAQTAARRMAAEGVAGSIVNISSQMGHVGGPERSVYCATKHAMEGFTKAMAIDFRDSGLRANTLCPTYVVTPLTAPFFEDPDFSAHVARRMPMGRPATPGDVAAAAVFLCSDASAMMTGSALKVDGGWTAA